MSCLSTVPTIITSGLVGINPIIHQVSTRQHNRKLEKVVNGLSNNTAEQPVWFPCYVIGYHNVTLGWVCFNVLPQSTNMHVLQKQRTEELGHTQRDCGFILCSVCCYNVIMFKISYIKPLNVQSRQRNHTFPKLITQFKTFHVLCEGIISFIPPQLTICTGITKSILIHLEKCFTCLTKHALRQLQ